MEIEIVCEVHKEELETSFNIYDQIIIKPCEKCMDEAYRDGKVDSE